MSEAQKLQRALAAELKKYIPDYDVIYAIKLRLPYANTVDPDRFNQGNQKLDNILRNL